MQRSSNNPWLARFAALTAVATLYLIGIGGVVTSKGVGMAVPDWPTSYGYNMFLLPWKYWIGQHGAFWEHSHRLSGAAIGLMTTILAVWLWLKEERKWMRWLGVIAWVTVVVQGLLGGIRVIRSMNGMGIFHGCLAQAFLCLLVCIAVFLSSWWRKLSAKTEGATAEAALAAKGFVIGVTVLIFVQLALGATMRHQHAGLAVPDFPLAYGSIWPATDAASIERYNQIRHDYREFNDITAAHINVHMTHRLMAYTLLALITWWWAQSRKREVGARIRKLSNWWLALVWLQGTLGVITVLKNKPADIATAHVLVGAVTLATGVVMSLILTKLAGEKAAEAVPTGELAEARG